MSATAAEASTWSVPSSGISQKAVANVPAIEPAVEIANRRPAVRPSRSSERARSRTATGETIPRMTLWTPNSRIVASSGFRRGPGSQRTSWSSTHPSTKGIASTSSEAATRMPTSSRGVGQRSATMPPSQYPVERPARTTPISAPQT
jgi:hypothetical protein